MPHKTLSKLWNYGPLLVVIGAVLWAMDGVLRRSLFTLPPITIVFAEHLIGTVILAPVLWQQRVKILQLSAKTWSLVGTIALISGVLGTLWFTAALQAVQFLPFSVVFLVLQLEPVFAISSSAVLLGEKLSKGFLVWAVAALLATFFVMFPNGSVNLATGSGTVMAALLALGATAAWGTSTTFSKLLLNEVGDRLATALRFVSTTVLSGVGVVLLGATASLSLIGLGELSRLVMIALSTGMVALYLYYRGLQRTEAKLTTFLELVFPCLAVFIDAVLYKSLLAPTQYLAAVVLLFIMTQLIKRSRVTPVSA